MSLRKAAAARPLGVKIAVALGLIYLVWGSTYLAIRVVVETLPPLTSAGIRFLTAGAILYAVMIRRVPKSERPTRIHWKSATIIGAALILGGNGFVVLAEFRGVPSGIAALLVGSVPLCMAIMDSVVNKTKLKPIGIAGILIGFTGVAILARPSGNFPIAGSLMVFAAVILWSAGSLYARTAALPRNAFLGTGMQMLAGGALQVIAGGLRGEWTNMDPSSFSASSLIALAYLILVGSLIGFTAYIWCLHNAPMSLVSTYAYVNPVIAVLLGAAFANETITIRDLLAGSVIVGSVALIVTATKRTPTLDEPAGPSAVEDEHREPQPIA